VLCKKGEIHLLEGNGFGLRPYRTRMLSAAVGCLAPLTMATIPVGDSRRWYTPPDSHLGVGTGIEVFDGASLLDPLLSHDIRDKFDPKQFDLCGVIVQCRILTILRKTNTTVVAVGSAEGSTRSNTRSGIRSSEDRESVYTAESPSWTPAEIHTFMVSTNSGTVYRLENGTDFDGPISRTS